MNERVGISKRAIIYIQKELEINNCERETTKKKNERHDRYNIDCSKKKQQQIFKYDID